MQHLISYLKYNRIDFKQLSEEVIEIDSKTYQLLKPTEGKLFTENFVLIADNTEYDNYIFNFGGIWYSTPNGTQDKPELNKVKWLGKSTDAIITKSFLGVRGGYELLNGSGLYKDWCKRAKFLQVQNLGICEKNTLAGIMKFQLACKKNGIKAVLGATYTILKESDIKYDLKFYVKTEDGWNNLLMINKHVNVINHKFIKEEDLGQYLDGLVTVLDPKSLKFEDTPKFLLKSYYQLDTVIFEDESKDQEYLQNLKKYTESNLQPISITDAFYIDKEDSHIKIKLNTISNNREYVSKNQYFKSKQDYYDELEKLFNTIDDRFFDFFELALNNESKLVSECNFNVITGIKHLPEYIMTPEEKTAFKTHENLFWSIIEKGINERVPEDKVDLYLDRIETEFKVIKEGGFIDYFLILWDIINWSHSQGILTGIGRGSGGGSLIAYLTFITHIDPIYFDLPFERFFNKGRIDNGKVPDIDCDFQGDRKEEVKHYMERRYGAEQVCSIGTYTTLQLKAAIKDLSRVYNLNAGDVNWMTTVLDLEATDIREIFKNALQKPRLLSFIQDNCDMINDVQLLLEQPKAASIHACATLILPKEKDIYEWTPVRKALSTNDENILVSEWEGSELEEVGFLKEDILGIRQLDKFSTILSLIKENNKTPIDIYNIPYDDTKVLSYFKKGWSQDTFHFGSKGLTGYCKEMKSDNIDDLIAAIALYRPGTMESNLHNEYIFRKEGEKEIEYDWGTEAVTRNTYGILIFQEQIMQTCVAVGGFNLTESDDIRVAMGKKKRAIIDSYKIQFLKGAINKGCPEKEADDLWNKLEKFAGYSFNKAHATAYAITGYISQYLKVYYPIEFWTTAFKYVEKEEKIPAFISEINKTGAIKISPPDINNSFAETTSNFKLNTIYWSLESIKGLANTSSTQIIEDREKNGNYFSLEEFLERHNYKGSKVNKTVIEGLVLSGSFDSVESIEYPIERYRLIKYYREKYKVKTDKDKDLFEVNKDSLKEDYWWQLQSKKLSGLAFFDYKELCDKYIEDGSRFIEGSDYQSTTLHEQTQWKIGGILQEVIERTSKKKGKYAQLLIESNYQFIYVTLFPTEYQKLTSNGIQLLEEQGNIILLSGQISNDSYKKENTMRINDKSSILILK